MVHLIIHLNHTGHSNVESLMKIAEDYVQERRNYKMKNYWTEGTSIDDRSDPFQKGYNLYVREPDWHDKDDKDQYGHRKSYQEYGWHSDAERDYQEFQGQRGVQIKGRFFPSPGNVVYTWKIRQMTDWSHHDFEAMWNYLDAIITKYNMKFKHPHQYSEEEISEYMRALDLGFTTGNLTQHQDINAVLASNPKMKAYSPSGAKHDDRIVPGTWVCSLCLGGYTDHPDYKEADNFDYKCNACPISTEPCCGACDKNWVLPARMGCNPYKALVHTTSLSGEPMPVNAHPFKYPVPEGFQWSDVGDAPFTQVVDEEWKAEELVGGRMNDKRFIRLMAFSNEAKVNQLNAYSEAFKRCAQMAPHDQDIFKRQVVAQVKKEEKDRRDYMEMTPEMAKAHADQIKEIDEKMKKVEEGVALSAKIEAKFKKANVAKAMMEQKCQKRINGMKSDNERKTAKIEELKVEISKKEEYSTWQNDKLQEQEAWSEMDTRIQNLIEEKRLENDDKDDVVSKKALLEAWKEWVGNLCYTNAVENETEAFQDYIETIYGGIHKMTDKQRVEMDTILDSVIAEWKEENKFQKFFNR